VIIRAGVSVFLLYFKKKIHLAKCAISTANRRTISFMASGPNLCSILAQTAHQHSRVQRSGPWPRPRSKAEARRGAHFGASSSSTTLALGLACHRPWPSRLHGRPSSPCLAESSELAPRGGCSPPPRPGGSRRAPRHRPTSW
jgi:hypothetical protein